MEKFDLHAIEGSDELLQNANDSLVSLLEKYSKPVNKSVSRKTRLKNVSSIRRKKMLEAYVQKAVSMLYKLDRFIKSSVYSELEDYINQSYAVGSNFSKESLNTANIKTVLENLDSGNYRAFLKQNISGVKNPKDKIDVYVQYHIHNINLLLS